MAGQRIEAEEDQEAFLINYHCLYERVKTL